MGQRCGEGRCTSALENAALVRPSRVTLSDALHIQELELIAIPLGRVRHAGPDLSYGCLCRYQHSIRRRGTLRVYVWDDEALDMPLPNLWR